MRKQTLRIACTSCARFPLTKDEIGISKKLLGEEVKECYCIDCLSAYLEVTPQEIEEKIQMFKEEGCILFQ